MEVIDLTIENWPKVKGSILRNEKAFKKAIRSEKEDYEGILSNPETIAKVGFIDSLYVGNIMGYPIDNIEAEEYGLGDAADLKLIYLHNIAVSHKFQGKGYGKQLMKELIRAARLQGYDCMVGHFRPNGSLRLALGSGAVEIKTVQNWEGTKETFHFCKIPL